MVGGATSNLEELAERRAGQVIPEGDVNEEDRLDLQADRNMPVPVLTGPRCDRFRPRRLRGHGASTGIRRGIAEHLKLERSEFGNA